MCDNSLQIKVFHFSYQESSMHFQYYLIFLASFGLCVLLCGAEFPYLKQSVKADGSLSFLVVGDWGRKGLYNQSDVAFQVLLLSLPLIIKAELGFLSL